MERREISDSEITRTLVVEDLLTGNDIGTWQADYLLREVEFERLKNGKPTYAWANNIGLTTFGFALNLFSKGYADHSLINKGEWIALGVGVLLTIILFLVGRLWLSDSRKVVMKKIEKHFEEAPTQRRIIGG